MRWIEKSLWVGAAMMLAATAAQAQILVVRASGPSAGRFKPGSTLPVTAKVALKAGDVVTLLDSNSSWTLRGPGNLSVQTRQAPNAAPRLMAIDAQRARVGATRPVDADFATPDNIYLIDVARPGATCVADVSAAWLWRADGKAFAKTTITAPDGTSAEVEWPVGQQTREWPKALPLALGATYAMTGDTGDARITLKPLGAPAGPVEAGQALAANGCAAQLDLLAAQLAAIKDAGS
jgi:hypothetical protein